MLPPRSDIFIINPLLTYVIIALKNNKIAKDADRERADLQTSQTNDPPG